MKTRKRRQEEQETLVKRSARLRLKIDKFINPSTVLRVFNNFFIHEEYFNKDIKKYVPHQSFFEFNRIIKGKIMGDFIKFTVIPLTREFEFDETYIIQRYLSFGDSKFKALADALAGLRDLKKHIPSLINQFPKPEDLLKRCNSKSPIFMMCDNPASEEGLNASPSSIYISMAYMMKNGWTNAQQYILDCVKSGHLCLPFLVNTNGCSLYVDRMIAKLQSSTRAIKNALAVKMLRESESSEISQTAQATNMTLLELSQRYANRNQFVKCDIIQYPFLFCSQIVHIAAEPIPEFSATNMYSGLFDEEEYDLLEKLIPVSQNRLKRFQDKVCSYRELSKAVMCKEE